MFRRVVTFLIASALVGGFATAATAATTPTDLFVDNHPGCSNTGTGSAATPFCTIQAAAAIVLPGQTVHVAAGQYTGPVTIARSGERGEPITFVGGPDLNSATDDVDINANGGTGIHIAGAHDVIISGFHLHDGAQAVAVSDSTRITVEDNSMAGATAVGVGLDVSGQSSDVTASRNLILNNPAGGISLDQGVTATTITTNVVDQNSGPGIAVDDAPDTVITSNTLFHNCTSGISLAGTSPNATVENNILDANNAFDASACQGMSSFAELAVSADSTTGTTADYNIDFTGLGDSLYDWAGTAYSSVADFTAATGQGTHDLNQDPGIKVPTSGQLVPTSPAVDSADSTAPGELTLDQTGQPRVDDVLVPDTGIGVADRGAVEVSDPFAFSHLALSPTNRGPVPFPVTISATMSNPWSTPLTFTFDFGDGSAPVVTTQPTATHTYTVPSSGFYNASVTATTPSGAHQSINNIQIAPTRPAPLVAKLRATQIRPLTVDADNSGSTDSWRITDFATDFGDDSGVQHTTDGLVTHAYSKPGTYTVTTTETDFAGNTDTVSQQVTIASPYFPLAPVRVLDTRNGTGARAGKIGANGVLRLKLAGTHGIPATGVRSVVLNVTAISPTASSFLTVYPDGTTRPVVSNLNYVPGQTVPNLVTVPVGAGGTIDIFNHIGTVDVAADLEGYYADNPVPVPPGVAFLTTVQPQRLLDTRTTGLLLPLGPGGVAFVPVNPGNQIPSPITAVVLNVTATDPTTTSFLTVYPDGAARPTTSNLNFTKGQTTSNLVTVPVINGAVDVFNHVGSTHVVVDLEAYYSQPSRLNDATTTSFTPLTPTRLLDTRTTTGGHHAPLAANGVAALQVRGVAGIPTAAIAVVLNVTAVAPTQPTFVTVYPDGTTRPATSNLNVATGQTVPNLVVAPIGTDGKVDFFNHLGNVNVVADVAGYFAP